MKEFLKVDLRIARQRSGLKGQDVATLLGTSRARLSKLENGYARPKVKELICLSIIYDKALDELFQLTASRLTEKLQDRLSVIDANTVLDPLAQNTLTSLADRLLKLNNDRYDA